MTVKPVRTGEGIGAKYNFIAGTFCSASNFNLEMHWVMRGLIFQANTHNTFIINTKWWAPIISIKPQLREKQKWIIRMKNNILTFTSRKIMNNSKENVDYIQTFKSSTLLDCHEKCFGGSVGWIHSTDWESHWHKHTLHPTLLMNKLCGWKCTTCRWIK